MVGDEEGPVTDRPRNFVVLCGKISVPADERRLPSGDVVLTTRIVVERDAPRGRSGPARSKQRIDVIDCVAWSARIQRVVRRWQPGDRVCVEGAIRRRFFRADKGLVSRFEVEMTAVRLVATADGRHARLASRVVGE
jgi:single-strand DNA-binding protein